MAGTGTERGRVRRPLMPEPLRTVLIAHPGADLYGSDRVMLETLAGLLERGVRVVLTAPIGGPLLSAARSLGAETHVVAVPVLRRASMRPRALARVVTGSVVAPLRIRALLRQVRPDAVYVSTLTIPLWQLVASARLPVIVHVHESERGISRLLRTALVLPLLAADRLIVNSRYTFQSLAEVLPSLGRKATIISNGVPGPRALVPARTDLSGGLTIAYVGRLSPRKGVDVALSALAALRKEGIDATLNVVGAVFPGYEWYEARLHDQARRLGISAAVHFHGFLPSVWDALADSDVVVVPSRREESFGNSAAEALLAGRPVVASAIGGLVDVISGFPSAIPVRPGDPEQLAQALARVASEWDLFRRAAAAASESAERRFATARYRSAVVTELLALTAGRSASAQSAATNGEREGSAAAQ